MKFSIKDFFSKSKSAVACEVSQVFLVKIGSKLVGLLLGYLFIKFLLSFLWTGTILPFFQSSGNPPSIKALLK